MKANVAPKSNSPGFVIGAALWGVSWAVAVNLDVAPSAASVWLLPLAGVSCLPLAIALAELRSGYAWKNLAEGGRGVARIAAPGQYWRSITFYLLLAGSINAFNLWAFFHPELPAQ